MVIVAEAARTDSGAQVSSATVKRVITVMFALFALLCVFGGGSAFPNILAVTGIRITAILLLATILLTAESAELRRIMPVLRFSILAAALVAVQLIPLPPDVWAALPGHGPYAEIANAAVGPVWRPVSMTPDLTLNALLALLVPTAAALAAVHLGPPLRSKVVICIVAVAGFSAALGLLQLAPGGGALRWYALTNDDSAVGIFTNRNHHGVFLAVSIPLIAVAVRSHLAQSRRRDSETPWLIGTVALSLAFAGVAVATGSRFGTLAALAGLFGGALVWRAGSQSVSKTALTPRTRWLALAVVTGTLALVAMLMFLPGSGVRRLFNDGIGDDLRIAWLTPMFKMGAAFQPFGTGFGSFDSVYRNFEPFELLQSTYLNAAHNDLLQIVIEGGLGAVALFAVFGWWWARTTLAIWAARPSGPTVLLGRAASLATGVLLLASLFDYPLRTPLLASFFAVLSVWMRQARDQLAPLPAKAGSLGASSGGADRQSRRAE